MKLQYFCSQHRLFLDVTATLRKPQAVAIAVTGCNSLYISTKYSHSVETLRHMQSHLFGFHHDCPSKSSSCPPYVSIHIYVC